MCVFSFQILVLFVLSY
uniref:Uncharacterized protein n=1 Tax=Anguilla anguilla TaxID=7936 RepID=A0A0E9PCK2_ANGAN